MRDGYLGYLVRIAAVCLIAAPAAASSLLVGGEPRDGQELSHGPTRVLLRFTEPVRLDGAALEDEAGRGFAVRFGAPEDAAGTLTVLVRVAEALPPGAYRLRWSAYVPAVGRVEDGALRFTVLAPR